MNRNRDFFYEKIETYDIASRVEYVSVTDVNDIVPVTCRHESADSAADTISTVTPEHSEFTHRVQQLVCDVIREPRLCNEVK